MTYALNYLVRMGKTTSMPPTLQDSLHKEQPFFELIANSPFARKAELFVLFLMTNFGSQTQSDVIFGNDTFGLVCDLTLNSLEGVGLTILDNECF